MSVAQTLRGSFVDRPAELALQLGSEQPSAHPDLAVNAPHRQLEPFLAQSEVPGAHVIIDAVDERAVEIEQEGDSRTHVRPNRRPPSSLPQFAAAMSLRSKYSTRALG